MWELTKTSKSGSLVYERVFDSLEEVAKFLKTTEKVVEQIQRKERFPKGKTCVFNKYNLREIEEPRKAEFLVKFD
jgi:hypothetical protein